MQPAVNTRMHTNGRQILRMMKKAGRDVRADREEDDSLETIAPAKTGCIGSRTKRNLDIGHWVGKENFTFFHGAN